jgi:NADH:ubiquinone oxidoreductase subunit
MPRSQARELLQRIGDWLLSRRLVGTDEAGNRYYEAYRGAGLPLRRYRERPSRSNWFSAASGTDYAGEGADSVNILWWQWLIGARTQPPSAEELVHLERQQAQVRERVAALAEKERSALETEQLNVLSVHERVAVLSKNSRKSYGRAQVTPVSAEALLATGTVYREWTSAYAEKPVTSDGGVDGDSSREQASSGKTSVEATSTQEPPIWISNRRRPRT